MKYTNYLIIFGAKTSVILRNLLWASLEILSVMREDRMAATPQHTPSKISVLFVILQLKKKPQPTKA